MRHASGPSAMRQHLHALGRGLPLIATGLLAGCSSQQTSFLDPHGPVAALQRYHFWQVTLITLIVVLPVLVGVPLIAWRYRYSNTAARYTPHWDLSHALEWAMWVVPAIIVAVLGTYLWIDTHKLDPYAPIASAKPPLHVQVVGLDWKWLFIYPDQGIATVGQLAFPQDRPVSLDLTTDTVMQSFMIPALVGQIYAMPGMRTKLNFAADHTGSFTGFNTQYNGDGFHDQHFTATAMTTTDFDSWVSGVKAHGVPLDLGTYARLGASSTPQQVRASLGTSEMPANATYFGSVLPGLFDGVLNRYLTGRQLSDADQPGSVGYGAGPATN